MSHRMHAAALAAAALAFGSGFASAQDTQDKPAAKAVTHAANAATSDDDENSAEQAEARKHYVDRAFERFDTNKDGKIDRDEFAAGIGKYLDRQRHAFNRDFEAADANHDGKLSKAEAQAANPMLAEHFDDIDANHDGFLTRHEIRESIREQQARVTIDGDNADDDGAGKPATNP